MVNFHGFKVKMLKVYVEYDQYKQLPSTRNNPVDVPRERVVIHIHIQVAVCHHCTL